jgi:hypothetical protein
MKKFLLFLLIISSSVLVKAQTLTVNKFVQLKKVSGVWTLQVDPAGNGSWVDVPSIPYVNARVANPLNTTPDATHRWWTDALAANLTSAYNNYPVSHNYNTSTGVFSILLNNATTLTNTIQPGSVGNLGDPTDGDSLLKAVGVNIGAYRFKLINANNYMSLVGAYTANGYQVTGTFNPGNVGINMFAGQLDQSQIPSGIDPQKLGNANITASELDNVNGGTSPFQTQINSILDSIRTRPIAQLRKPGTDSVFNIMFDGSYVFKWRDSIGAVGTGSIADNSITTAKLQDGAVTTVKIPDANITQAKISWNTDVNVGGRSIYGNSLEINSQSGTTYTLQASDLGKLIVFTNSASITLTIPSGLVAKPGSSSSVGFSCTIKQKGAGKITITGSGTTVDNKYSYTKTNGASAIAWIMSDTNNSFTTSGDLE